MIVLVELIDLFKTPMVSAVAGLFSRAAQHPTQQNEPQTP